MKTTGKMKVLAVVLIAAVFLLSTTVLSATAVPGNGAQTYGLYTVSYGSDVGSYVPTPSTYSKLLVNQPTGDVQATVTGVLNGLAPNTEYAVSLSDALNAQYPWTLLAFWTYSYTYGTDSSGSSYAHMTSQTPVSSSEIDFAGMVNDLYSMTGTITGDSIALTVVHSAYNAILTGTIWSDGSITGTWYASSGSLSGTWSASAGSAFENYIYQVWNLPQSPTSWAYDYTYDTSSGSSTAIITSETLVSTGTAPSEVEFSGTVNGLYSMTGTITGNSIAMTVVHTSYSAIFAGTIGSDGSITGTWYESTGPLYGIWSAPASSANEVDNYETGSSISPVGTYFTTDMYGSGSWHLNLEGLGSGTYYLSVYIDSPTDGAILVSDVFTITVPSSS